MKKTNYNQLILEQRQTIQYMIDKGHNFTEIGKAIFKDRTTVSKKIKRNRYVKSYFFDAFDPNGIKAAIDKCDSLKKPPYVCNQCKSKNKCNKHKMRACGNIHGPSLFFRFLQCIVHNLECLM